LSQSAALSSGDGARRRQPFVERSTVLEVESARGMIARLDAIELLAAGSMAARRAAAFHGQRLVVRKVQKRFDGLKRPTFRSASAP
jgi:hypothetical protein